MAQFTLRSSTVFAAAFTLRSMNSRHLSFSKKESRTLLNLTASVLLVFLAGCNGSQEQARRYIEMSERQWAESVASNDSSVVEGM